MEPEALPTGCTLIHDTVVQPSGCICSACISVGVHVVCHVHVLVHLQNFNFAVVACQHLEAGLRVSFAPAFYESKK